MAKNTSPTRVLDAAVWILQKHDCRKHRSKGADGFVGWRDGKGVKSRSQFIMPTPHGSETLRKSMRPPATSTQVPLPHLRLHRSNFIRRKGHHDRQTLHSGLNSIDSSQSRRSARRPVSRTPSCHIDTHQYIQKAAIACRKHHRVDETVATSRRNAKAKSGRRILLLWHANMTDSKLVTR